MSPPPVATNKLDKFGLDAVCEDIADGKTMIEIARRIGVSFGSLSYWLAIDVERSARARDARRLAARFWDESAVAEIRQADDPFELSRAKEVAQHYRWRASKIAPAEYGERITQEHTGQVGFVMYGEQEKASTDEWTQANSPDRDRE